MRSSTFDVWRQQGLRPENHDFLSQIKAFTRVLLSPLYASWSTVQHYRRLRLLQHATQGSMPIATQAKITALVYQSNFLPSPP
jgi:hypothetical protein